MHNIMQSNVKAVQYSFVKLLMFHLFVLALYYTEMCFRYHLVHICTNGKQTPSNTRQSITTKAQN